MKVTQIMKGILLSILLVIPVISVIAQVVDPPDDIVDLVTNFDTFVASLAGYAAVAIWVTGLINGWFAITKSWVKQIVSWIIPIVLVVASSLLGFGFLAEAPVVNAVIFGLGAGLVSNGIFDIAFVNTAVNWLVGKLGGRTQPSE